MKHLQLLDHKIVRIQQLSTFADYVNVSGLPSQSMVL